MQALAGKAPNVQIAQSAGDPGRRLEDHHSRPSHDQRRRRAAVHHRRRADEQQRRSRRRTSIRSTPARRRASADRTSAASSRERRRPNQMMDLNPADIESVEILKGRGGGGDLRRARGERRHPRHDQAWSIGPDALLAAQLRHRMTRSRRSIRCSGKYGQGQRGVDAPITRSWGAHADGRRRSTTPARRSTPVTSSTTR